MSAPGPDPVGDVLASMRRDLNCLTDSDRAIRKRGLTRVHQRLFDGGKDTPSAEIQQEIFVKHVLPLGCRLLGDPVEKIRELSIEMMGAAVTVLPDPAPLLAPLLPAVAARIGVTPVAEDAEELRLQMLQLLGGPLLARGGAAAVMPLLGEVAGILVHAYADPFHEMIKAAATASEKLAAALPHGALETHLSSLIKSLVPNLAHRHSAVRLAVLKAADALVLAGAADAVVIETVVPAVRKLVTDHTPAVRSAAVGTLAGWMLHASSTARTTAAAGATDAPALLAFPTQLLPLLLLAVKDDNAELATKALATAEQVGEAFAARAAEAAAAAGGGADAMEVSTAVQGMSIDAEEAAQQPMALGVHRGAPFLGRPGAGLRALVRALLKQLLPPVLKDVREWTVSLRLHAARLLYVLVLLAEGAAEDHADALVVALCSAVGDEEADVAGCVVAAAHMLGNFVPPAVWVPLILEPISNDKTSPQLRANALVVMAALLLATRGDTLGDEALHSVATALTTDELRACDHIGVRRQLHSCVANLVAAVGPRCAAVSKLLFLSLLQLKAAGEPGLQDLVSHTLDRLAAACGLPSPEGLYAAHAAELLEALAAEEPGWEAHSAGRYLLESLLRGCTAPVLEANLGRLLPMVANCVKLERDPHIRMAMLRMLDELFEDPNRGPAFTGAARETVLYLLVAPAVWRAGKTAAAVRYNAVMAFSTFLERRLCPPQTLLGCMSDGGGLQLLPTVMTCMDEDYYADTRRAGTYLMEMILQVAGSGLTSEQRREIYPNLQKRLDDSNDEIRIRAASCCRAFFTSLAPEGYDDANSEYFTTAVVVHMDDADPRVQEAVCVAMEAAAAVKPRVLLKVVQPARNRHRSAIYCDRVLAIAAAAANH